MAPICFKSIYLRVCPAANTTGLLGYDFGAQSAFASVGAETDVAGKDVQARWGR